MVEVGYLETEKAHSETERLHTDWEGRTQDRLDRLVVDTAKAVQMAGCWGTAVVVHLDAHKVMAVVAAGKVVLADCMAVGRTDMMSSLEPHIA